MTDQIPENESFRNSTSTPHMLTSVMTATGNIKGIQAAFGLVMILIVFSILSPAFFSFGTYKDIIGQATVLGILASGTTIVLISGGLDLSVGSLLALVSVVVGNLMVILHCPVPLAIFLGLLAGAFCGFLNGIIQVTTSVPAFIVTLGGMMVYRGIAELIGSGKDLSRFPESFVWLGKGHLIPICILAGTVIFVYLFLAKTRIGFATYAIGGNEEVARLSGIKVKRNRVLYYTLGGLMAGVAAIVQTSRLNFANSTFGMMWELYAIAAVVIGGTSLFGGMGGVGRTVIGALIIQSIRVGLSYLRIGSSEQKVAIGIIIVLAVWFDVFQRRRAEKP